MPKYFNYEKALELMIEGHTTSVCDGEFDYYVVKNQVLFGRYSCDDADESHEVENEELEVIKNNDWYLIQMAKDQEEFENQPKEKEVITKDEVGSLEDVLGADFFE